MNVHWKAWGLGVLIAATVPLIAEKPFVYKELRTPKPADWKTCSADEFRIDRARLAARDRGLLYGDREGLLKLARFYEENADGRRLWRSKQVWASRIVNDWYFRPSNFDRHIYRSFTLDWVGFIYTMTGHKLLGRFLHDHIMQIARLPEAFWLHRELRVYKPDRPYGMIETGQLSRAVVSALSGAEDLFTPEELAEVNDALRRKALAPMLNYLEDTRSVNNFLAIVGIGTYVTGKYLNDPQARAAGKAALLRYINGSVEEDGSYGEGIGYFEFPMGALLFAVAAMSSDERKNFFEQSGLRRSPEWLAYPYLYSSVEEDKTLRCVYGDNSYMGRPSLLFLAMIADVYGDPVAAWLGRKFSAVPSSWLCGLWEWALVHFSENKAGAPATAAVANLPLIRGFANGENFIRSSWEPDGTVLSLYTAGPTRVNYAHQRPERNSVNLGAYGEYFIVSPHSSSYRSPIYYEYDHSTLSANTVRIDHGDQLFPMRKAIWGTLPPYANYGRPVGKLIRLESNPDFDVMTGDARLCYKEKPAAAFRTILYRRPYNYFVVIDRMAGRRGKRHTYTALWHFNNRDGKLKLAGEKSSFLSLERPRADLAVFTGADCDIVRSMTDGYMHGPKRDYSPGGAYEGKPGSAKVLNISNAELRGAVTFVTVLQPLRKGEKARPVSWKNGRLAVGSDSWNLEGGFVRFGERSVPLEDNKTEQ